jgi:hypothetical protein
MPGTIRESGMSRSAFSIKVFGWYALALGLVLVLAPNLLLPLLRFPPTSEVWIRALGVVLVHVGALYWVAARSEAVAIFRASVWLRLLVPAWFVAFVLLGLAGPLLLLFGAADAAGALWTWLALRSQHLAGLRVYPNTRIDPKFNSKFNSRM